MSTTTKVNILVFAFIVACAFVQAEPVAKPECIANVAPVKSSAPLVFADALVKIQGHLVKVVNLNSKITATTPLKNLLNICVSISGYIDIIVKLFTGSCNQMKPTDAVALFISLDTILKVVVKALIKVKSVNLMVKVYANALIKLCVDIRIYISLCLKLVVAVAANVDVSALLNIYIKLGTSVITSIFVRVYAALQLCVKLNLGVSVGLDVIVNLLLQIGADIRVAIDEVVSLVVGLLPGIVGVPKNCTQVALGVGVQVLAIVQAILDLFVGVQINVTAIVQAIVDLRVQIQALAKVKLSAAVDVMVKLVLKVSVNVLSKTCSCYKKTGSGMMGKGNQAVKNGDIIGNVIKTLVSLLQGLGI